MAIGFSTSSSNASLPFAMKTAQDKLGVPKAISSFVQPLGATINMDGTAIMQGVATVFIAQVYGVELTLPQLAMVVLTAVLASIGTAGCTWCWTCNAYNGFKSSKSTSRRYRFNYRY